MSEIEQGGAGCVLDQRLSSACFVAGIRNLRDLPQHLVSVRLSVSLVWLKWLFQDFMFSGYLLWLMC